MRDGKRALFRYKAFFTILGHLKLNYPYLLTDWANTKTVIPLSVGDQRWVFTSTSGITVKYFTIYSLYHPCRISSHSIL